MEVKGQESSLVSSVYSVAFPMVAGRFFLDGSVHGCWLFRACFFVVAISPLEVALVFGQYWGLMLP